MKLFFIGAQDASGESLDWFVRADSKERAIDLWERTEMVVDAGDYSNLHVFLVPSVDGPEGAVDWEALP